MSRTESPQEMAARFERLGISEGIDLANEAEAEALVDLISVGKPIYYLRGACHVFAVAFYLASFEDDTDFPPFDLRGLYDAGNNRTIPGHILLFDRERGQLFDARGYHESVAEMWQIWEDMLDAPVEVREVTLEEVATFVEESSYHDFDNEDLARAMLESRDFSLGGVEAPAWENWSFRFEKSLSSYGLDAHLVHSVPR